VSARSHFINLGLSALVLLILSRGAVGQEVRSVEGFIYTIGASGEQLRVPTAELTFQCSGLPANTRRIRADDAGAFRITNLSPAAACELSITARGFETKIAQVTVQALVTTVQIELKLPIARSSVDVQASAEVIEPTRTTPGNEISGSTLTHAPLAQEQIADAIPMIPGAVRGPDGLINIKGARSNQSGLVVNSVEATDPVTGQYGFSMPIEAVASLEVVSNPYDAQYGRVAGAVTNIQTRQGSDKIKVSVQNIVPRPRFRNDSVVGIEAATPRMTVSGPIRKGKMYFLQSLEYRYVRTRVPGLRHLDDVLKSDTDLESFSSHSQFDWDVNTSHRLSAALTFFPQKIRYVNLDTFDPQETTPNWHERAYLLDFADHWSFSDQSLLQSSFSIRSDDADVIPATPGNLFILSPNQNSGSYFNQQDRDARRYEWQELYFSRPRQALGSHNVRLGFDATHVNVSGTSVSHPVNLVRTDGTLAEAISFSGPGRIQESGSEFAWFAQDNWIVNSRVSITPGFRIDSDTLGEKLNPGPRLGFAIALTKDGRTVLRGGGGLFYDHILLDVRAFEQYQGRLIQMFALDGVTPVGTPTYLPNLVPSHDFENPRSWSWNAELDREVSPNLLLRASYQQRQTGNDFIVQPQYGPEAAMLLLNSGKSLYREYQLTAKYRLGGRGEVVASYVRSHATGDLNAVNSYFGNFRNVVVPPDERSLQDFDVPNRFLAWADLNLPKDVIASPVLDWRDGFPYSLVDVYGNYVGWRNRAGRYPRFFSFDMQITKGLTFRVGEHKLKARVGVRTFNLTNHFNPRDVQKNVDSTTVTYRGECSTFGEFCNSVGRTIRGKLVFEF
jgi:hypothetical protein